MLKTGVVSGEGACGEGEGQVPKWLMEEGSGADLGRGNPEHSRWRWVCRGATCVGPGEKTVRTRARGGRVGEDQEVALVFSLLSVACGVE